MDSSLWPRQILQALLVVPLLPLTIVLFLFVICLLPVRALICVLAKIFRPDLGEILGDLSCLFSSYPLFNVICFFYVDGPLSIEIALSRVRETAFHSNSDKRYENSRKSWTNFCGYTFWKDDPNFRLENHIREYDYTGDLELKSGCNEEDARRVFSKLLLQPWKDNQSPWELFLIPMSSDASKTLLIFRHHHALLDGFSASELFKMFFQTDFQFKTPKQFESKRNLQLKHFLLLPYQIVGCMLDSWDFQTQWHFPPVKGTRDLHSIAIDSVTVEMVKAANKELGTSYVSVLLSVLGGALQKMFEEADLPVPKYLSTVIPLPKPNHPGGLVNHMILCEFHWPIKASAAINRTLEIQTKLEQKANPALMGFLAILSAAVGSLPQYIAEHCSNVLIVGPSVAVSILPVSEKPLYALGRPITGVETAIGPTGNSIGTTVAAFGINGEQKIILTMDKRIFPSDNLFKKLGTYAEDELHSLHSLKGKRLHHEDKSKKI